MRSAVILLLNTNVIADELTESIVASFLAYLTEAEVLRYRRFLRPIRRREFLFGRILLRFAAASMSNIAIEEVAIIERGDKVPMVRLPAVFPVSPEFNLFSSLSHSRGWIACATSTDSPLGLDIEALDGERDVEALGRAAFTTAESNWLSSCPAVDRIAAFYDLWSCKEALYKLISNTNKGTTLPELVRDGARLESGHEWYAQMWSQQGFAISLCSRHPMASVERICLLGATPSAWSKQMKDSFH